VGWLIENDVFVGASGDSVGVLLEDKRRWCERNQILFDQFCKLTAGIEFLFDSGDPYNSFGYNIEAFDHFEIPSGGAAVLAAGAGLVYSNYFMLRANLDAGLGTLIRVSSGMNLVANYYDVQAEGPSGSSLLCLASGTSLSGYGMFRPNTADAYLCAGSQQPKLAWFDGIGDSFFSGSVSVGWKITPGTAGGRGASWSSGSSAPAGYCSNGSLYSNTSGKGGSTLYACVAGSWVDVK
ncbi:MAG: hypothetical protein ACRDHZ_10825, partial [Ktedonobacteraceae bacterium]